ncbi:hypothetical protein IQ251_18845, partial [Saccharopolyspora sp. HNM0983]|nr:hypothetical protein [Saccharopolyspora sp. HNM0983]
MVDMCYTSAARDFRNQMGGAPDAGSLPQPDGRGVEKWEKVSEEFEKIVGKVEGSLRKAEGAHEGQAADAANASIAEVIPKAERVSETSKGIRDSLQQQAQNQHEAFRGIPAEGDTLENGREVQIDPPEKGFVDEHKDNMFIGWMSDYEERQADHTATNEKATAARERYASQTDNVVTALPSFNPDGKQQAPAPPPNDPAATNFAAAESGSGSGGAPASTSSSWASSGSGGGGGAVGGSGGGAGAGGGAGSGGAPASTGSAWASPGGGSGGGSLPPGVVRGKDGSLYRQNPQTGAWERQGPGGRWTPAPGGGPGGARGAGGAAGAAGGAAGG